MSKRKSFYHLRHEGELPGPIYWDELGNNVRISAVFFTGRNVGALVVLPGASIGDCLSAGDMDTVHVIAPSTEEWAAILKATDSPEIFELDATGAVKAVHRKSMRAVGGALRWGVWRRDGFRCMFCGAEGGEENPLTVDHFVPVELGGSDDKNNLLACCKGCNKDKGSLPPEVYCRSRQLDYRGLRRYLDGQGSQLLIAHLY